MRPISCLLIALICCIAVLAQAPTGIISGTVTDESGAVISGASITIVNKATTASRSIAANGQGLFSAPALPPGDYEVRGEMKGLRTTVSDAQVVAGGATTVDLAMTIGESREVVTVEAATAQINFDSSAVQGIVARQNIEDLPLNGRSSLQFASLEPGVIAVAHRILTLAYVVIRDVSPYREQGPTILIASIRNALKTAFWPDFSTSALTSNSNPELCLHSS
jgi:Carboxypeptidase regulatory-like domain